MEAQQDLVVRALEIAHSNGLEHLPPEVRAGVLTALQTMFEHVPHDIVSMRTAAAMTRVLAETFDELIAEWEREHN